MKEILLKIQRIRTRFFFSSKLRRNMELVAAVDNSYERKVHIYYRISDVGYKKNKPEYINNKLCINNAINAFDPKIHKWVIIADRCSKETLEMVRETVPDAELLLVDIGSGAGTFRFSYQLACKLDPNSIVYFLENDYLHQDGAAEALFEGLLLSNYVSLYDHPDKYSSLYNNGEKTKIMLSNTRHWKATISTTMTFCTTVFYLRKDWPIFDKWTRTDHPYDHQIFIDLHHRGRCLISPIPSLSTHGETALLAPLVNWKLLADRK